MRRLDVIRAAYTPYWHSINALWEVSLDRTEYIDKGTGTRLSVRV